MDINQINAFMAANSSNFPPENLEEVKSILTSADPQKTNLILQTSWKNPTTILILAICLGSYGVDRFMLGETGLGVAKLLTCGGCGIWALIDWFTAQKRAREYNLNMLRKL